jgi:hypothetical protein
LPDAQKYKTAIPFGMKWLSGGGVPTVIWITGAVDSEQ